MNTKNIYKSFLILLFFFISVSCQAQLITTIAGTGVAGYGGDGGPATAAEINHPQDVVKDRFGNVYIVDGGNNRIRMINTSGIINTIAGNGTAGFSGDGGPATAAQLYGPLGLAVDYWGNIYITDGLNNRVRKVLASTGIITTIAGTGVAGNSGDGGPATDAQLNQPLGIDLQDGNVYFADGGNFRVRYMDTFGIIRPFAGDGSVGYYGDGVPATNADLSVMSGVIFSTFGRFFIADQGNNRVRMVQIGGYIYDFAGTGVAGSTGDGFPATTAELNQPSGVASDGLNFIYIADYGANRIRIVDTDGIISNYAGTGVAGFSGDGGPATAAQFYQPVGVGIYLGGPHYVYVADQGNNRIRLICPKVTVQPITAMPPLCVGETFTLGDLTTGGVWSSSNTALATAGSTSGVVHCLAPGTVTFRYFVSNQCGDTISAYMTDSIGPLPFAGSITGVDTLCQGDTATLSDTVSGGTWLSSNTAVVTVGSTGFATAGTGGSATIKYFVTNPCGTDTARLPVYIKPWSVCALGLSGGGRQTDLLSVVPNPNSGDFTVNLVSANVETVKIVITNMLGEQMTSLKTKTNKPTNVHISTPPGVYYLTATTANETLTRKVVVE